MIMEDEPYALAQAAMAQLKTSVYILLRRNPAGMKNAEVGRQLGIYMGHVEHEGHIPRTLLGIMEAEGVVVQHKKTKIWKLTSADNSAS